MSRIVLTDEWIDKLIDPKALINKIEEVLRSRKKAPKRPSIEEKGSWFSTMLAGGLGYYVVKIVGVYPENPKRELPLVRGVVMLFDAENGDILMEASASSFTGWRTAATTALALRMMRTRGGTLGLIGAGFQGKYHVEVMKKVIGFDRYLIYDIAREKAKKLAEKVKGKVVELEDLLEKSDVIISATTSRDPLVKGSMLKSEAKVVSIGAPKPIKEVDVETIRRAGCILVDTREGVLSESGCIEEAIKNNVSFDIVELGEIARGERACKPKEIWFYKSVGTALLDLATAIHLFEMSRKTF